MFVPRLLLLSLVISLSVNSTLAAQSPSEKNSQDAIQDQPGPSDAAPAVRAPHILTLQQDENTCYTLRTYRVARENPESDSTRPAGYSTCQRATRFQLKTAVESLEIVPR